jgi:hypothetical protein
MKVRVAVGIFLAFLPVLAFAQSTIATQLLQALVPPNAIVPAAVSTSTSTTASAKAAHLKSLYAELATLEAELAALEAAIPSSQPPASAASPRSSCPQISYPPLQ